MSRIFSRPICDLGVVRPQSENAAVGEVAGVQRRRHVTRGDVRQSRRQRLASSSAADARRQLGHTIRYDTRCYFNVRSKANTSQLNLPHGTDN